MIVIVKFHRESVDGIHIFIQTQKIKESLITIAGNRGTPLTLKLLLVRTSCFLMFPRNFLEVCMFPESLKICHFSMKLRRETYCQSQLM